MPQGEGRRGWGAAGCTKNPTQHQNCIIFCAVAILVAFTKLEGKGGGVGEWWVGKRTQHHKFIIWLHSLHVWERGGWGGLDKNRTTIKIILRLLYVLYWLHLQHLWERGDGGLDTNPTHHQNCIICAAFVILVAFATCVGTHRNYIAAYKKYVRNA